MRQSVVQKLIGMRASRRNFLPQWVFDGEAPWDLLLELYSAKLSGHAIEQSSLAAAANVPSSVASRWLQAFQSANLVVVTKHMLDGREILAISDEGYRALESWFDTLPPRSLSL